MYEEFSYRLDRASDKVIDWRCANSKLECNARIRTDDMQMFMYLTANEGKLEDLKVLRHSPDLLNNVKIGQGQLQLIMEQILFYHIWGL